MDWKWIDRAYQFESKPSGGGAEEKPPEKEEARDDAPAGDDAPAVSDADSGQVSDDLETRADLDPVEGAEEYEGDEEGTTTETAPVGVPDDFGTIFKPTAPTSPPPALTEHHPVPSGVPERPPAAPAEPAAPPKADFPGADDWLADAGEAAKQQAAAIAYANWESQAPLRTAIGEIQGRIKGEDQQTFEQTVRAVEAAVNETGKVVDGFYAEDGPLNSDAEFRNNPELQKIVKNVILGCVERGVWIAEEHGKTGPLERITRDPKFIRRILALAKADVVTPDSGFAPGASPVTQQPLKTKTGDGLSADQRKALQAARAAGSTITAAEIRKATKKTQENIW